MLVAITGRSGAGKDTAADILEQKGAYLRLKFADPIKECIKSVFSMTNEQVNGSLKNDIDDYWKVSPRTLMQFIGTELFREQLGNVIPDLGENIFVRALQRKVQKIREANPNQNIVITDLRFDNEAQAIRELNGTIIKLIRPSDSQNQEQWNQHPSELLWQKIESDYELTNDGSIDDLWEKISNILLINNDLQ